jgi:hypothetical protein
VASISISTDGGVATAFSLMTSLLLPLIFPIAQIKATNRTITSGRNTVTTLSVTCPFPLRALSHYGMHLFIHPFPVSRDLLFLYSSTSSSLVRQRQLVERTLGATCAETVGKSGISPYGGTSHQIG